MKHTKQNKNLSTNWWVTTFWQLCCELFNTVLRVECIFFTLFFDIILLLFRSTIMQMIHNIYISLIIYTLEKSSNCHRHGFVHKFTLLQLKHINTKHLSRVSWIIGKLNHNMKNKIFFFCLGFCRWNWELHWKYLYE